MLHETCSLSRYTMYREIEKWIDKYGALSKGATGKTVGGVSPLVIKYPSIKWEITNITIYNSTDQLEWSVAFIVKDNLQLSSVSVDAEDLPWDNDSIDIIMMDQVLEHLPHPWIAAKEALRVLKPNGILIAATTCLAHWHGPAHYFNFHCQGLQSLFSDGLDDTQEIAGWGNKEAINLFNFNKKNPLNTERVANNAELLKLANTNNKLCPYVVWVCGRKKT